VAGRGGGGSVHARPAAGGAQPEPKSGEAAVARGQPREVYAGDEPRQARARDEPACAPRREGRVQCAGAGADHRRWERHGKREHHGRPPAQPAAYLEPGPRWRAVLHADPEPVRDDI
ncbi:hypothetical protein B0H17DRAFT_1074834, partial [Mycena rosella]